MWAVTRVKPEQAPKGLMGVPSPLIEDEGRRGGSRNRLCDSSALRGIGHSTHAHIGVQHGRPVVELKGNGVSPTRRRQESEEAIVPSKPGNAGGGKGLWFEVRLDETRVGGLA